MFYVLCTTSHRRYMHVRNTNSHIWYTGGYGCWCQQCRHQLQHMQRHKSYMKLQPMETIASLQVTLTSILHLTPRACPRLSAYMVCVCMCVCVCVCVICVCTYNVRTSICMYAHACTLSAYEISEWSRNDSAGVTDACEMLFIHTTYTCTCT